jgi:gamma-glutamyl-gamma-aminobutyrate hydrolase PuuD
VRGDIDATGMSAPLIGITADLDERGYFARPAAAVPVGRAGGVPVLLPCLAKQVEAYLDRCDGLVLSGGDDPIMETWGVQTHPSARPVHPKRQAFELALLEALGTRPELPVLGICLGMQFMGLFHGGALDQHLPDTHATAGAHWPKTNHPVEGELAKGSVHSHHRQALTDPGSLRAVAWAPDGVIEAVRDEGRPFYLGVQWHPERTDDVHLGRGVIESLVEAARA